MRKTTTAVAVALTSALGVTVIAQAVDVDQTLSVRTAGTKGTKAKPRPITIDVTTGTSAKDGRSDGTYGTTSAVIHFDRHLRFNNARFPTCSQTVVSEDASKCPKGSKVGGGRATAEVGPGGAIEVNPTIDAYNGKDGALLLQLVSARGEADASGVIVARLKRDSGTFGKKLDVRIPERFQQQFGLFVTLTKLQAKVGATYRGIPYVQSTGCTGTRYRFAGDFTFTDGTKVPGVRATSRC